MKYRAYLIILLIGIVCSLSGCGKDDDVLVQKVDIKTTDGITIKGMLYLPCDISEKLPGVVFSHMAMNSKESWDGFARKIVKKGYIALSIDFRGYGESGGDKDILNMYNDVLAGANYLANFGKVDRHNIAAVGASMGGMSAVIAAAKSEVIKSVVTISSPPYWEGLEAAKFIGSISPRPVLVIAGSDDGHLSLRAARILFLAAKEPREWLKIDTNRHGTDIFATMKSNELENAIIMFLNRTIGKENEISTTDRIE